MTDILAKYNKGKRSLAMLRASVNGAVKDLDPNAGLAYSAGVAVGMIDALTLIMDNIEENDGAGIDLGELIHSVTTQALAIMGEE